jgi:hypothetical protein
MKKKMCVSLQDLIVAALSTNPSVGNLQIFLTSLTSYFQHNLAIINTSDAATSVRVTVSCNEGCFHCHKTQLQVFTVKSNCRIVLKTIKKSDIMKTMFIIMFTTTTTTTAVVVT